MITKTIQNLVIVIKQGIINEATKNRMDELEEQKNELKSALAASKLRMDLGSKKEHITYFLHQFVNLYYSDIDCQKEVNKDFS